MVSRDKPHCVLHIGMHKTGSSSIQATLCKQEINSDFEFVNLMPSDLGNSSHPIYSLFYEQPEIYYLNKKYGFNSEELLAFNQQNLVKLTEILTTTQAKTVIVSAEDMFYLSEKELYRLREFLTRYCQSVQIICYVRPFVSYMQSKAQQMIKGGIINFAIDSLYPSYREAIGKFDAVFDKESVLLVKFDASNLLGKDVVLDFFQRIGMAINPESIIRQNEALSLEAVALLYAYYKFGFGYDVGAKAVRENDLLIGALTDIGGKKLSFSSGVVNTLLAKYSDDIEWIEERLGCTLKEPLIDSKDAIASLDDLLPLGVEYADDLKKLLFAKIQQQEVTSQKLADWVHLLRVQLSISDAGRKSPVYSIAQIEQTKATVGKLSNLLKEIFLSLSHTGVQETVDEVRDKIMPFLQNGIELVDAKETIAFSIDLYEEGYLMGWVLDKSDPSHKLAIELHGMHGFIGAGLADRFRKDLVNTVSNDGCCAFKIKVDPAITGFGDRMVIRVVDYNKFFYVKNDFIKKSL